MDSPTSAAEPAEEELQDAPAAVEPQTLQAEVPVPSPWPSASAEGFTAVAPQELPNTTAVMGEDDPEISRRGMENENLHVCMPCFQVFQHQGGGAADLGKHPLWRSCRRNPAKNPSKRRNPECL